MDERIELWANEWKLTEKVQVEHKTDNVGPFLAVWVGYFSVDIGPRDSKWWVTWNQPGGGHQYFDNLDDALDKASELLRGENG